MESSTVSMKLELMSHDGCKLFEHQITSQDLEFGQKLLPADTEVKLINGDKVNMFHTENELADYYYACLPVEISGCALGTLTLSKGGMSAQRQRDLKDDFLATLSTFRNVER